MTQTKPAAATPQNRNDWVKIPQKNGDLYFGETRNGEARGWAVYTYANGDRYEGEWADGGRSGRGAMRFANGDSYDGNFRDDLEDGRGAYGWKNGDVYVGHWNNGGRHGKGRLTWEHGDEYDGEWKDDRKHGRGTYRFNCDDLEEYKQGLRLYAGLWKKDEKFGEGACTYANGDKYEGEWREDMHHGGGAFTFGDDGTKIEGQFRRNLPHGRCVQTFVNGDSYDGHWKKGKKQGEGIMTKANAEAYRQVYKNNRLAVSESAAAPKSDSARNDETVADSTAREDGSAGEGFRGGAGGDRPPPKKRRGRPPGGKAGGARAKAFRLFLADFKAERNASGDAGPFKERGSVMKAAGAAWKELSSEMRDEYRTRASGTREGDSSPEGGKATGGGGAVANAGGDADGLVGNSNVERQGQYRHQLLARQDGTGRGAEGLVNNGSVGPQGQHRQQSQVRQEHDGREGAEGLVDISNAGSQGRHRQQSQARQDRYIRGGVEESVGSQGRHQQQSRARQEQEEASLHQAATDSVVNVNGDQGNETERHVNGPGDRDVASALGRAEAPRADVAVKMEEDEDNEPQSNDTMDHEGLSASGHGDAPQANNADGLAPAASMEQNTAAAGMSDLELGPLYANIKRKLARSETRDGKKFYGHLKGYCSRKMRDGNLLSPVDFDKINDLVSRFESNTRLLNDKGNDYDDICVYGGFIKHIIKECTKELATA